MSFILWLHFLPKNKLTHVHSFKYYLYADIPKLISPVLTSSLSSSCLFDISTWRAASWHLRLNVAKPETLILPYTCYFPALPHLSTQHNYPPRCSDQTPNHQPWFLSFPHLPTSKQSAGPASFTGTMNPMRVCFLPLLTCYPSQNLCHLC